MHNINYSVVSEEEIPQTMRTAPPQEIQSKYNKKVRNWANCLICWSWVLIVCGAINVISNVFFLFIADSFTSIWWVDQAGKSQHIELSWGFWLHMALSKIIGSGYLFIRQGRATLAVVEPMSNQNLTGLSESKIPRLDTLKREVWRITVGIVAILFLTVLVLKVEASDKASQFVA